MPNRLQRFQQNTHPYANRYSQHHPHAFRPMVLPVKILEKPVEPEVLLAAVKETSRRQCTSSNSLAGKCPAVIHEITFKCELVLLR
jgi:hypothetical protein